MNRSRLGALAFAALALLLPACTNLSTREAPSVSPKRIGHVYVEHRLADGRDLDQLIAAELRSRGYDATAGQSTMMPEGEDAIVDYVDTWTSDFTTYLIELDITVRDARSGVELATGRIFKPSLTGTSPQRMIAEVMDKIFKPHVPPVATTLQPPS